jgi:hypothetical protein
MNFLSILMLAGPINFVPERNASTNYPRTATTLELRCFDCTAALL